MVLHQEALICRLHPGTNPNEILLQERLIFPSTKIYISEIIKQFNNITQPNIQLTENVDIKI